MKVEQRSIKKHLFICTNKPSCGDNCGSKNSEELVKKFPEELRNYDLDETYNFMRGGKKRRYRKLKKRSKMEIALILLAAGAAFYLLVGL